MTEHLFHTLVLRSEYLILHEVTNGPFISDESLLASFSPPEDAKLEGINYLSDLKEKVKLFYLNNGI